MGLEPTTFELEVQRASIAPRGLHTGCEAQTTLKYQSPLTIHSIEHPTTTNNSVIVLLTGCDSLISFPQGRKRMISKLCPPKPMNTYDIRMCNTASCVCV